MDKETFIKEAQKKIDFLSAKIDELQKKLEPMTADARKEAKVAAEKTLAELKVLRGKLQVVIDEAKVVAEAKWGVAKKNMEVVIDDLSQKANVKINQVWEKLKSIFD